MSAPRSNTVDDLLREAEWMRALARRLLDRDAAEDAVQDAWVVALEKSADPRAASRPWLAGVFRNLARDRWRGERARRRREESVARPEAESSAAEVVARAQAQARLVEAVLALEESQRSAILHHYFDGVSAAEIARREDVPGSTVRNRLKRGIDELRRRLEREGGASWALMLAPIADFEVSAGIAPTASAPLAKWIGASAAGGLAMSTGTKVASAVALVAAVVLWSWTSGAVERTDAPDDALRPAVAVELANPEAATSSTRSSALATTTDASAVASSKADGRASLRVKLTWAEDGSPARDVGVKAFPLDAPDPFVYTDARTSNADGVIEFESIQPGRISLYCIGGGGRTVDVPRGEQTEVALTLSPGIIVEGLVVDADGRPVPGATIWLSDYGNGNNGHDVTRSAGDGSFRLRASIEGYRIAARAAGFAPSPSYGIEGNAGDVVRRRIVLAERGGALHGIVRGPSGDPLTGALVHVGREGVHSFRDADGRDLQSAPALRARTDGGGRFAFDGVAAGTLDVVVRAPTLAPWSGRVTIDLESAASVSAELVAGAIVRGVVLDGAGTPLAGLFVGHGEYGSVRAAQTYTRLDGSYALEGLPAGAVEIRVAGRERGDARATLELSAGVETAWDPVLVPRPTVAGRVVDEAGEPIVGWKVGAIGSVRTGLHLRSTSTDATGAFRLENWPKEARRIEVREPDSWSLEPAIVVPDVSAGRQDLVIQVPHAARSNAALEGRVIDEHDVVIDGAVVWFGPPDGATRMREPTDARTGKFRVGPIRSGTYRVSVEAPGRGELELAPLTLAPDERRDLGRITLATAGRLLVEVVGVDGQPTPRSGDAPVLSASGGRVGTVVFDGIAGRAGPLQPGRYVVRIVDEDARGEATVEVASGEDTPVQIRLERTTSRTFEIEVPKGFDSAEQVRFVVADSNGVVVFESSPAYIANHNRMYHVRGLTIGAYSAEARATSGASGRMTFTVEDLKPGVWLTLPIR